MKERDSRQNTNSILKYITAAAAIIGCLGTIIFGYLAIKVGRDTMKDARNIARESGFFDKPDLRLLLGSEELETVFSNEVFLGAPLVKENAINLGKLTFILVNKGKKTAKSIGITDQFPKIGRPSFNELLKMDIGGFLLSKNEIRNEIKDIGNFSYFFLSLPVLNPGQAMLFDSVFLLKETELEDEFELQDKSKVRMQLRFGFKEEITISAEDLQKSDYSLTIQVFQSKNEKELVDKVIQFSKDELKKKRDSLSFPTSRLAALETQAFVAFTAPNLTVEKKNVRLYEYNFRPENIHLITVSSKPNTALIWLFLFALIGTIAGLAFLLRYIRKKLKA